MPHYPRYLQTFTYKGSHRYFLTFCTHQRAFHFSPSTSVGIVLSQILRTASSHGFTVSVYCFMPDHLHLLSEGIKPEADLKAFVARAKQRSGYYFQRHTGQRLWQRYGYERVLRADETTQGMIRYIIENPVRAGLTIDVASYPFWGSTVYSRDQLIEYTQHGGGDDWAG